MDVCAHNVARVSPSPDSPYGGQIMRTKRFVLFLTALLVGGLALAVTPVVADQHTGTWKMNPEKSKYSPGPAPKSTIVKIEADEKGIKVDAESTNADGSVLHVQYDAKFDGKDYAVTGIPDADMVSVKRIGGDTIESTLKKGGQVVMTVTSKVSKDGKTRTSTFKGKDPQGNEVNNVVVLDKQ